MKPIQATLIAATLMSSLLTACGSSLTTAQPGLKLKVPALQSVPGPQFRANYVNLILETSYEPDLDGHHFGFDFGSVIYINKQGKTIDLNLRYSRQARVLWVSLQAKGAPLDQREHIKQEDKTRLAEVARELRGLFPGTEQDQANLDRITALLEHPPVRP